MGTNSRLTIERGDEMVDNQSNLDVAIDQLRDVQYDLEMYDPDYSGYTRVENMLHQLEATIKLLEEMKARNK